LIALGIVHIDTPDPVPFGHSDSPPHTPLSSSAEADDPVNTILS
jgi:hypothetical protein